MILTHYGAWWTPIGKYTGKVNYPGVIVSKEDYEAAPDTLKPELEPYFTQVWDVNKIREDFKDAIEVGCVYNGHTSSFCIRVNDMIIRCNQA
jgi:endoglucanase